MNQKCTFLLIESNDFDYITNVLIEKSEEYLARNIDLDWMQQVLSIEDDIDNITKEIPTMLKYNPICKSYYIDFEEFSTMLWNVFVGYATVRTSETNSYSWITI